MNFRKLDEEILEEAYHLSLQGKKPSKIVEILGLNITPRWLGQQLIKKYGKKYNSGRPKKILNR